MKIDEGVWDSNPDKNRLVTLEGMDMSEEIKGEKVENLLNIGDLKLNPFDSVDNNDVD